MKESNPASTKQMSGGVEKRLPVAVAIELDKDSRPKRIALRGLKRVDARSLPHFSTDHVAQGFVSPHGRLGQLPLGGKGRLRTWGDCDRRRQAAETFLGIHTFIGNLKRMILVAYHSVLPKDLDRYLGTLMYRANRRWMEAKLFDRLVIAAARAKSLTLKELIDGASREARLAAR